MNAANLIIPVATTVKQFLEVEYVTDIDTPSGTAVFLCNQGEDDTPLFVLTIDQAIQLVSVLQNIIAIDTRNQYTAFRKQVEGREA